MAPYVSRVIEHEGGGRTLVFSDGSEAEVIWHGGMGDLMPAYNSRSQWSMFIEHAKFADPGTPFPKTNEDIFVEMPEEDRPDIDDVQ